jgi:zinc transporter ZupT
MSMTIAIAILVFAATLAGGFFALRFKDKLHLIIGFSAGAVLGIAFLDLLPEAVELTGDAGLAAKIALGGVIAYMIIDRIFFNHGHSHEHEEHKGRGIVRAASLVIHSFLDGLAIGFSFQVSVATGTIVAIAVLAHDFSDGINTVAAILKGGDNGRAKAWLMADALAPVAGIIIGTAIVVNAFALGVILSIFTGFFVYIALADMIPESFHQHPKKWTTIATVLGALFILIVIGLAS